MKIRKYVALIAAVSASAVFAQEAATPASASLAKEVAPQAIAESSAVSASAGLDVASAAIYRDGGKLSDSMVIQPSLSVSYTAFDSLPLDLGLWANYDASSGKDNGATQDSCFTEVDLSIGTSFDLGNDASLGVSLVTWQYPNMEGWNGEELLAVSLAKTIGPVEIGSAFEKMLTGDYDDHFDMYPYVSVSQDVTDDVSVGVTASFNYAMIPAWEGPDGWTAYGLSASVSAFNFSAYATYYGQMNDQLYTDDMNDDVNTVFGVGYSVDL